MAQDRDGDGLIENRPFLADWMDSILKKDKDFYLNLLFYEGLRACQAVKEWLGHADEARRDEALVGKTGGGLQRAFWNGRDFTDRVRRARHGGGARPRENPSTPLGGAGGWARPAAPRGFCA